MPQLDDRGQYVASESTFYRVLREANQLAHRERSQPRRHHKPREHLACGPDEVWTWDITKLLGPWKWTYYYLYVILDIFSRYVVGWMLSERESAELARQLIAEACRRQAIVDGELTIHADRGPSMTSKSVALLLADLGVVRSHSRPRVSNDNPFSESQFKTLKTRPEFPERFGSLQHGRAFGGVFFDWYNHEHRHSGIAMLTPAIVHYGQGEAVLACREAVLADAYRRHPERFLRGRPQPKPLPEAAWINPPAAPDGGTYPVRTSKELIAQ